MPKDIAVLVGEKGETVSFFEPSKLKIFRKNQGHWHLLREKSVSFANNLSMKELRREMEDIIIFLGDCQVLVGQSLVGVPYFALEKAGFHLWEYEGTPSTFLDYILEREEESAEPIEAKENVIIPLPQEVSPGCYQISLKDIQEGHQGITSKQVLMPFLKKGQFYTLEVTCSHVPPWLEAQLTGGDYQGEILRTAVNEYKLTIQKKCCC